MTKITSKNYSFVEADFSLEEISAYQRWEKNGITHRRFYPALIIDNDLFWYKDGKETKSLRAKDNDYVE